MRSSISLSEKLHTQFVELKKEFNYTLSDIVEIGIRQAWKSIKAKRKYALETNTTIAFITHKKAKRIIPHKPTTGWYKIIFIKNIEFVKLNKVIVHYHDYEFTESRRRHEAKEFMIDRIEPEILNRFR